MMSVHRLPIVDPRTDPSTVSAVQSTVSLRFVLNDSLTNGANFPPVPCLSDRKHAYATQQECVCHIVNERFVMETARIVLIDPGDLLFRHAPRPSGGNSLIF